MYDAFTTRYTFACPERGEARVALSSFRESSASRRRAPGRLPRRVRLPLRRGAPGLVVARRARLGAARPRGEAVPQPDDRAARAGRGRARRPRRPPHPGGRVALELLLLPGGAAAARVPVVVLPARAGRGAARRSASPSAAPSARASRSTSSSHEHVDLPFHNDRRDRRRRARLRRRCRPRGRGVRAPSSIRRASTHAGWICTSPDCSYGRRVGDRAEVMACTA